MVRTQRNSLRVVLSAWRGLLFGLAATLVAMPADVTWSGGEVSEFHYIIPPPRGMVMMVRAPDVAGVTTNRLPFFETFEGYADGTLLVGARGWVPGDAEWPDPDAAVVAQWDYAYA